MIGTEVVKHDPIAVDRGAANTAVIVGGESVFASGTPLLVPLGENNQLDRDPQAESLPRIGIATKAVAEGNPLSAIAQTNLDRASRLATSAEAWMEAGFAALAAADHKSAERSFRRALELTPGLRAARLGLARIAHETGQTAVAKGLLRELLDASPEDVEARTSLAVTQMSAGDPIGALETLGQQVALHLYSAGLFAVRGGVQLQLGKYREAVSDFRKAARLRPDWVHVRNALGVAELKAGHASSAERHFREAQRVGPLYAESSLNLLRLLRQQSRWNDLLESVDHTWIPDKAPFEAALLAGNACLKLEDYRSARSWFLLAESKTTTPDALSDVLNNLGVALYRLDRQEEAGAAFERAASTIPSELTVTNRAKAYFQEGKYEAALEWLQSWHSRLNLDSVEPLRVIALCLSQLGHYDKAIEILHSAQLQEVKSVDTQILLSGLYVDGLQDFESAIKAAEVGLAIDPGSPGLINNLAYALLEADRVDEAAQVLQSLDELRVTKSVVVFLSATRGLLALKLGDLNRGTAGYEQALTLATFHSLRERVKAKRDLEVARAMLRLGYPADRVRQRLLRAANAERHAAPYNLHAISELKALPQPRSEKE